MINSHALYSFMTHTPINPSLAIGVIIQNKKGKILFVQETRDKYYEKANSVFGLPSGKIEWTEKIEDGLKREIREELAINIKPVGLIGVYQYVRDNSQCIGLAFTVELENDEANINCNQKELKSIQWFSIEEALSPSMQLRTGTREVLEDYKNNQLVPFSHVRFFDLMQKD
ncbi:MAG: hypothetical protein C0412_21680 [Flavobacterium sp.]|nr:hypothetical protein [Flavobacterium sp.]